MKILNYLSITFLLFSLSVLGAQKDTTSTADMDYPVRKLTIEPGIGINPWPMPDMLLTNLVQWNIDKRWSILSFSSISYNNAFLRDFNYIKTNYNYSISQKLGIGFSFYGENTSHTFSFIAGIKYDTFKETLENPEFENVSASINSVSPDLGLMYNLKIGKGKYFYSLRMYLPLYPYPMNSSDIWSIDGNLANLSLEIGLGIFLE
jgi:hypothetical protein